jgi:hypothetical protein
MREEVVELLVETCFLQIVRLLDSAWSERCATTNSIGSGSWERDSGSS